jgi:peptidoglycan-associated lipoprotein
MNDNDFTPLPISNRRTMMFALRATTLGAALIAAALAGCSSSVPLSDGKAAVETRNPNANAGAGAGSAQSDVKTVDLGANQGGAVDPAQRTVYFDFDSYVVKDEYRPIIETNAKRLSGNKQRKVVVEGHTDDRGGSEYNLALGQKRAEAVAKSLTLLGVDGGQVEAVSFGKERPAVQGSDEAAWAKNRRAELKDR